MGPGGGPGDSDALPPAPRRPGDVEGGRPVARVSTVFTGSGDARARAFDAQSGALQRVFRGHALVINCIQVGAPPSRLPRREGRRGKRHRPPHSTAGGTSSPRPRSPGPRRPPRTRMPGPERGWSRNCGAGDAPGARGGDSRAPAHAPPRARRCTARCCTRPRTTARCASGTCAGSRAPRRRAPPPPSAASPASSATRWAAPPPRR